MKKFLFFLLVPLFAFTQYSNTTASLTFKDIMSIDSKEAFLKQMFKHRYTQDYEQVGINYSLNPTGDGQAISFAQWFEESDAFWFQFVRTGTMFTGTPSEKEIIMDNSYDNILNVVDRRCKYVGTESVGNYTYAVYDCKKAKFDRNIGFALIKGGSGIITQFIKK